MPKFYWMLRDDHPRNFIPATGPSAAARGHSVLPARSFSEGTMAGLPKSHCALRTIAAYVRRKLAHVRLTTPEHRRTLAHFDFRHIEPSDCRPGEGTMAGLPKSHCALRTIAAYVRRKYSPRPFDHSRTPQNTSTF